MNSEDAYELFNKGKKLSEDNDHLNAIMDLEKAMKIEPEKASIREALARSYYNSGFYSSAKKHFKKIIEIDASNDYAYFGMGLCLLKEGKVENALGNLKIAFAMKPDSDVYKDSLKKYKGLAKK